MTAGAALWLSLALLVLSWAIRPTHGRCPPGYDLRTGIDRAGRFRCWPRPIGDEDWSFASGRPDRSVQPDGVLESRLYCTGGAVPHQDGASVWCQR